MLIVPPFAEELNKSRRMLTHVALALAARGVASVMPDLYGTGDSDGEFRDADWEVWKQDLLVGASWANSRGWTTNSMLALRLGCPLGAEAAVLAPSAFERCVYWQPVVDGERFMTQFLRLRVAASMMADQRETVNELRERMRAGECVEVAGYELAQRLCEQIDALTPDRAANAHVGVVHWMEVVRDASAPPSPATQRVLASLAPRVAKLENHAVAGEPFWAATEIVVIPELVDRTVELLSVAA